MNKFTIIIIIILLTLTFIIPIPKYIELNNLLIIDNIYITCNTNNKYTIYFEEIIPNKDDNGIKYNYNIYKEKNYNLEKAYNKLKNNNKNIYLNKTKIIKTNCKNKEEIKKIFNKNIKYKSLKQINKELRKKS